MFYKRRKCTLFQQKCTLLAVEMTYLAVIYLARMKNLNSDTPSEPEIESGRKVAEKSTPNKPPSNLAKWKERVRSSTGAYNRGGPAEEFVIRLQVAGARQYVLLGTTDIKAAAERARQLFFDIKSVGWDAAIAKLYPAPPVKTSGDVTVGEYLAHIHEERLFPDEITFYEYAAKFRTLLSHLFGIHGQPKQKWVPGTEASPWHRRIDRIKLKKISPSKVTEFMPEFVSKRARTEPADPRAAIRAKHTINCLVRNARALFSRRKVIPKIKLQLPTPLPFDGVRLLHENNAEFRFVRQLDPNDLVKIAAADLAPSSHAQFVIFLLCLSAGLRRNEVDKLCWSDVDLNLGQVEVTRSFYQKGKSTASLRKIKVSLAFKDALKAFRGTADRSSFVIPSSVAPRENKKYRHYRCSSDFDALIQWLRKHGVNGEIKALHALRKYFGDTICNQQSIYAAAKALGHQKVSTTEIFYAAPPDVAAVSYGADAESAIAAAKRNAA